MREDICSIPVNEVLEKKEGCPVCSMQKMLTDKVIQYITGSSVMEPDVRTEANRRGYCGAHLHEMTRSSSRLSIALLLETRLCEAKHEIFSAKTIKSSEIAEYKTIRLDETCFVCDKIEWGLTRFLKTLFKLYNENADSRKLFEDQKYLCIPHAKLLVKNSRGNIGKKHIKEFSSAVTKLTADRFCEINENLSKFKDMFDYRYENNSEADKTVVNSIYDAVEFLTGSGSD